MDEVLANQAVAVAESILASPVKTGMNGAVLQNPLGSMPNVSLGAQAKGPGQGTATKSGDKDVNAAADRLKTLSVSGELGSRTTFWR